MDDFDLDLRTVEEQLDDADVDPVSLDAGGGVELGVLDGTTPPADWIEAVEAGSTLVLAIEGELNELASGFARDVYELGGDLVHFRGFLIVTPPAVSVDTSRLD